MILNYAKENIHFYGSFGALARLSITKYTQYTGLIYNIERLVTTRKIILNTIKGYHFRIYTS